MTKTEISTDDSADRRPFARLAGILDPGRPVVVQTHDYPDIDAVASAWALAELLRLQGFTATLAYRGEIRSRSLSRLILELGIVVSGVASAPPLSAPTASPGTKSRATLPPGDDANSQIIVVDGSPANGNVSLLPGEFVGVIDHHCKGGESFAPFVDIRPELASSSTMLYGYWAEAGEVPGRNLATAILAGIQSDTDFLSRRSSPEDFRAYTELFALGDGERSSRIVRTVLDLRELGLIARALSSAQIEGGLLYASLEGPCAQEALSVLADFALRAEELYAAVAVEHDPTGVHFSVRSKSPALSAFDLVRRALEGIGTGGGHSHSAGGIVPAAKSPGDAAIRDRFFAAATKAIAAQTAGESRRE